MNIQAWSPAVEIAPMSVAAIANVEEMERRVLMCPQEPVKTQHVLHAGMYSRTITLLAGRILTGAVIKVATQLVINGDVLMSRGDDEGIRITGCAVIPACAGRKQAFITYADTSITMVFRTNATTVAQAEAEFTDDTDMLFSRRDPELNTTVITGE